MNAIKLPFQFNVQRLKEEVMSVPLESYHEVYSTKVDLKSVYSLELIAPKNTEEGILNFQPTDQLQKLTYISEVYHTIQSDKHLFRIHKLQPGKKIRKHSDRKINYESGFLRLHIPIQTNDNSFFMLDGQNVRMLPGECWYVDVDILHEVENKGETERIHLVMDCIRNPWWDQLFKELGYEDEYSGKYSRMGFEELIALKTQFELINHDSMKDSLKEIDAEILKRNNRLTC